MTSNIEGRLSRADIGWLAAAIFMLFIGMTFVLFFDQRSSLGRIMRTQMSASPILRLRRQR